MRHFARHLAMPRCAVGCGRSSDAAQAAMRDIGAGSVASRRRKSCSPGKLHVVHIITPPGDPCLSAHGPQGRLPYLRRKAVHRIRRRCAAASGRTSAKGLRVCAGHQLLYEPPTRVLTQYLPSDRRVVLSKVTFLPTVRHAAWRPEGASRRPSITRYPFRIPSICCFRCWSKPEKDARNCCRWKSVRPGRTMRWCV